MLVQGFGGGSPGLLGPTVCGDPERPGRQCMAEEAHSSQSGRERKRKRGTSIPVSPQDHTPNNLTSSHSPPRPHYLP